MHIKASGWGTRVTLRATRETPAPQSAAARGPTGEETGLLDAAETHDTAHDTDASDTATPHTAAVDTANPETATPDIANPDTANPDTATPHTAVLELAALDTAAPGFTLDPAPEPSSADPARLRLATDEQPEPEPKPAEVDTSEVRPTEDPSDQPAPRLSLLARLLSWRRRNRLPAEVAELSDHAATDEQAQDTATDEPPAPVPMDTRHVTEARSEYGYPEPGPDAETPRADPEGEPAAATTEATHEPEPEAPATEATQRAGARSASHGGDPRVRPRSSAGGRGADGDRRGGQDRRGDGRRAGAGGAHLGAGPPGRGTPPPLLARLTGPPPRIANRRFPERHEIGCELPTLPRSSAPPHAALDATAGHKTVSVAAARSEGPVDARQRSVRPPAPRIGPAPCARS